MGILVVIPRDSADINQLVTLLDNHSYTTDFDTDPPFTVGQRTRIWTAIKHYARLSFVSEDDWAENVTVNDLARLL